MMGQIKNDIREHYFAKYPQHLDLITPFLAGFNVTWANVRKAHNTTLHVFFLAPEPHIQEAFGFDNEVMLVYSPYKTIEPRALQAAEQILSESPAKGRVETLNYFLVSDDLEIDLWLQKYTASRQESRIVVTFVRTDLEQNKSDPWYVRKQLAKQCLGRDLFNYSLPLVEDAYFFGRQQLLMEFVDATRRVENRGVFGLRKTGKTSFLFKLQRTLEAENIARCVYLDCKLPHIRSGHWYDLLEEVGKQAVKVFNLRGSFNFSAKNAAKTFLTICNAISNSKGRLCLLFDEIEFISFMAKRDPHWKQEFVDFWQVLWSAQSQSRALSCVLAGVNPTPVETDLVDGVQNPLFGIVQHQYLTGFSEPEVGNLIRNIGKRAGIRFSGDSIRELHSWYGGHPLLTRLACSWYYKRFAMIKELPFSIERPELLEHREECDRELVFYCGHIVSELREFYPEEYEALEIFASGNEVDFRPFVREGSLVRHLVSYGLISSVNNKAIARIPVVVKYVGAAKALSEGRSLVYDIVVENKRTAWLKRRCEEIITDLRVLEKLISRASLPLLFGPNSFPEADRFIASPVATTRDNFQVFVNTCSRCLVESIEVFGRSIGRNDYFWKEAKDNYPELHSALRRIKLYRNEQDHLELNAKVNGDFLKLLMHDFEGKPFSQIVDPYFVLQQRILDGLLLGIQLEVDKVT